MHLTVTRLSDEELTDRDVLPKVLREHMADGMIVNYTHEIPPNMLELLRTHRTPAVWINNKLDADCVYPDDFAAAAQATEKLLAIGHRRICFVHLLSDASPAALRSHHYSVADRIAGYGSAMRSAGLTPRVFDHERALSPNEQLGACRAMLTTNSRPTALLLYSDHDLSTLMYAAAYEGLDVPRDLSVLVFYPTEPWVCGRQVSNIALPSAEIGRRAARMLLRKIKTPEKSCQPEAVRYDAHLGQTVAPPEIGVFSD
jgi:LacI family transcriptional regulator